MQNSKGGASAPLCWGLKPRAELCEPGTLAGISGPVFLLQREGNAGVLVRPAVRRRRACHSAPWRCSCRASAPAEPRSCPPGAATLVSEHGGLQRPGHFLLTWDNPVGLRVVQGSSLSWERLLSTLCAITPSLLLSWILIPKERCAPHGSVRAGFQSPARSAQRLPL